MSRDYDAIVIGGGHNGLVAATTLAKAGRRVLVLEGRDQLGGAAAAAELFPGFQYNIGAPDAGLLRPEVIDALDLNQYGLELIKSPVTAFAPQPDGKALTLWRDLDRSQAEIARFSEADAERFPDFVRAVTNMTTRLSGLLLRTPPDLSEDQLDQLLPWFQSSLGIERLTHRDFNHFFRILPLSAAEFLDEWFDSQTLKGALGSTAIAGSMQGPFAPWSTLKMLYHYLGDSGTGFRSSCFVRGGMGRLAAALAGAAREQGVEIRLGTPVSRMMIDENQVAAVVLADGQQISAQTVLSSTDARRTFFDLIGAPNLELRFVRKVKHIRYRGSTAKVNLALRGLPDFAGQTEGAGQLGGHILISPSLEYLERAYDDAKYGRFSNKPFLDIVIPTVLDPSLAPAGQHVMSITVQYAPYQLRSGTWDEQRELLAARVLNTLAEYAPNLKELILHQQVITPLDWERDYGLTEGSIYHAQMEPDQLLFMRPVAGYGRYRTPFTNLYLCGAGTHPGGGLTGAPGYNAARELLHDTWS